MANGRRGRGRGVAGYEEGGVFPLAQHYAHSEVGQSDHNLPESDPVELQEAMKNDGSSSNGVFDDKPNINLNFGVFEDNVALPEYAFKENGFGPSETVDWQTGTPVAVFASGLYNAVADASMFPLQRGPQYWPSSRDMADTDFGQQLRSRSIANEEGTLATPVTDSRGPDGPMQVTRVVDQRTLVGDPAMSGYGAFGFADSELARAVMSRRLVQVARPGVVDIVAQKSGLAGIDTASIPTWQWGLLGAFVGAVVGAGAAAMFPSKRR